MSSSKINRFKRERDELNEIVMRYASKGTKKFYNLDMHAYDDGTVPARTKEMLGLVASFVLRCDDCVLHHLGRCREMGVTDDEIAEVLEVGLVVGGSITIPHLRRALRAWDESSGK